MAAGCGLLLSTVENSRKGQVVVERPALQRFQKKKRKTMIM